MPSINDSTSLLWQHTTCYYDLKTHQHAHHRDNNAKILKQTSQILTQDYESHSCSHEHCVV